MADLINKEELLKIEVFESTIDDIIDRLNQNIINARKNELNSYVWCPSMSLKEKKQDEKNIFDTIIKLLENSGYKIIIFESELLSKIKVEINWKENLNEKEEKEETPDK
jgi:N-dimethylarginine dimethylaminohydrolase